MAEYDLFLLVLDLGILIPVDYNRNVSTALHFLSYFHALIILSGTFDQNPYFLGRLLISDSLDCFPHILLTGCEDKPELIGEFAVLIQEVVPVHTISINQDVRPAIQIIYFDNFD